MLKIKYPDAKIFACKDENVLMASDVLPAQGASVFKVGGTTFVHILTPGHTKYHSSFLVLKSPLDTDPASEEALDFQDVEASFVGDTIFAAGAGNNFECPAETLYMSLHKNDLSKCPDMTYVFCGHEYTSVNLDFSVWVESHGEANSDVLQQLRNRQTECIERRRSRKPTVPTILGVERATSPWMRCDQESRSPTIRRCLVGVLNNESAMKFLEKSRNVVTVRVVWLWLILGSVSCRLTYYEQLLQAIQAASKDESSGAQALEALRKLKNSSVHKFVDSVPI